jgi:WD40 repeat protein
MIMCKTAVWLPVLVLVWYVQLGAVMIGSDAAVNRFTTQVSLNNADIVASFASLEAGFSVLGINSNAVMRTVFPVGGFLALRQATITLGTDLLTENSAIVNSLGNIIGGGYKFDLSHSITLIPALPDKSFGCDANFVTSALQLSDVETSDWSYDNQFLAVGLETGGASHDVLCMYRFNGSTLTLTDASLLGQYQDLRCVRWHPSKLFLAVTRKNVGAGLSEVVIMSVNGITGLMTQVSGDKVNADVPGCAWHPSGNFLATTRNVNAAEVAVYAVNGSGTLSGPVATANYTPDRNPSDEAIGWDATGTYLGIGIPNNGSNPTLLIYTFNSVSPSLTLNSSINTTGIAEGLDFNPVFPQFIAVVRTGSGDQLEIYKHDPTNIIVANRIVKVAGTSLGDDGLAVAWSPDGTCLSVGKNTSGTGGFRVYSFDANTLALSLRSSFDSNNPVLTTRWSKNGLFVSRGGDDNTIYVYKVNGNQAVGVTFNNLYFLLGADLTINKYAIKCVGNCVINGRGNTLTLGPTNAFIVSPNSTLLLQDITIAGVNTNKIRCANSASVLSCENVTWELDGDFSFTQGKLTVIQDFCITGSGHTFAYNSDQISTINPYSALIVGGGTTFMYDTFGNAADRLQFVDRTSYFVLNDANLSVADCGLYLRKGTLIVDANNIVLSAAINQTQGIMLGDGISSSNDMDVKYLGESGLSIENGWLIYNNVAS